jgi:hypothetical protein
MKNVKEALSGSQSGNPWPKLTTVQIKREYSFSHRHNVQISNMVSKYKKKEQRKKKQYQRSSTTVQNLQPKPFSTPKKQFKNKIQRRNQYNGIGEALT